ncbi:hypothetical protein K461DRAFT_97272 [Myriangium duriaei CBS 260.36]|uniref:Pectate lyase n=1 Tax=Myriangium duriaei CBS 260.36 TaxID=1168546 RepID=A0A9P4MRF9_9PEZI|nr:hypothetical protein K461DRAFT_97272 [Myriangium duriaei CBS 260.36]
MLASKNLLVAVCLLSINALAAKIQYAVHVNTVGADGNDKVGTYWSSTTSISDSKAVVVAQHMRSWSNNKFKGTYSNKKVIVENVDVLDDEEGIKDRMIGEMITVVGRNTA